MPIRGPAAGGGGGGGLHLRRPPDVFANAAARNAYFTDATDGATRLAPFVADRTLAIIIGTLTNPTSFQTYLGDATYNANQWVGRTDAVSVRGSDGRGVPPGGADGQVLTKESDADFDTKWEDAPAGGGGDGTVDTDSTLTGDGSSGDPLKVANPFTVADEDKLDGIAAGAEVNVQSDWSETDTGDDSYIQNKPTLGTAAAADTGTGSGDVPVLDAAGKLDDGVIPDAIARDTELTAAVERLKGGAPANRDTLKELGDAIPNKASNAAVDAATDDQDYMTVAKVLRLIDNRTPFSWKGDFGSTSTYDINDVVRHTAPAAAFYVAITNTVPVGKTPGVASDWTTYWRRLGWEEGAPSSLVGGPTVTNRVMEFAERGGTTHQVSFPDGLGVSQASRAERISFQAISAGQTDPEAQPLAANPLSVVFGSPGELIITGVTGNDFTVAAGIYLVKVEAEATPAANNATISWELRKASDDSFIAQTTSPNMTGGGVARPVSAVAALFLAADETVNIQVHRAVQNSALAAGWSVTFMRWGGSEAGWSYYAQFGPTTTPTFTFPTLTDADRTINTTETLTLKVLEATMPAGLRLDAPIMTFYGGLFGGSIEGAGVGPRRLEVSLGYRIFAGMPKQVTFWTPIDFPFFGYSISNQHNALIVPLETFNQIGILAPGQYPTESDDLTSTLVTLAQADFDVAIPLQLLLRVRGFALGTTRQAMTLGEDFGLSSPSIAVLQNGNVLGRRTPVITPHVSGFSLTSGNRSPVAGSIGTLVYGYDYEVSQSSHATAMRVVGFKGTEANPSTVAVLATIAEADFHAGTGSVVIPSGVSLEADESYTVRLEVYESGQTPATDQPVSYKDARITAHAAAAANYHVGYVAYDSDDSGVADTLARITNFNNDTATSPTLPTSMVIALPTSGEYQLYLAAKASEAQPAGFTLSGLNATNAFYAAEDKTIGVAFKFYILKPINRLTSANNGESYGVTS